MKKEPYFLCTDGTNDEGLLKVNLPLVRVFDDEKERVISKLFDMGTCRLLIAEVLLGNMDKIISEASIC